MSEKNYKKFIKGLEILGLEYNNIKEKWKYCGGDTGRHNNYFLECCKEENRPEHEDKCVCDHIITENCYICPKVSKEKLKDTTTFLVLGNCCIKKFIEKHGRTCAECGIHHKNRKVNLCNLHRTWSCSDCGVVCNYGQYKCFDCNPYSRRY